MTNDEKIAIIQEIIREHAEMISEEAEKNNHASGLEKDEENELINFLNLFKI